MAARAKVQRGRDYACIDRARPQPHERTSRWQHSGYGQCQQECSKPPIGLRPGRIVRSLALDSRPNRPAYAKVGAVTDVGGATVDPFASGLPEFRQPPLVEVAVGLMFDPLGLRAIDLAHLYNQWKSDYPEYEEHAAIPASPLVPGLILEPGIPHLRLWFVGRGGRLIQIQRDRLIVNWRKVKETSDYPHYGVLRRELDSRFREFASFVVKQGLDEPALNSIELTYVNQVPLEDSILNLAETVSLFQVPSVDLGPATEANVSLRFDASSEVGHESATLAVNVQRSVNTEPPSVILQLACASPVLNMPDALTTLDRARYHVVRSFQHLTTEGMHEKWGIRR